MDLQWSGIEEIIQILHNKKLHSHIFIICLHISKNDYGDELITFLYVVILIQIESNFSNNISIKRPVS